MADPSTARSGGYSPQLWYIYILKCKNGKIYKGCTNNLEDRLDRHAKGQIRHTKDKLPVELITYQ